MDKDISKSKREVKLECDNQILELKNMHSILILVGVIATIIAALGIGYFFISENGGFGSLPNSVVGNIQNAQPLVLQGSYEDQSIVITNQTYVTIQGDYNSYNFSIDTNSTIKLIIQGNNNNVSIINGRINLEIQGNLNIIHVKNTVILSRQIQGNADSVI